MFEWTIFIIVILRFRFVNIDCAKQWQSNSNRKEIEKRSEQLEYKDIIAAATKREPYVLVVWQATLSCIVPQLRKGEQNNNYNNNSNSIQHQPHFLQFAGWNKVIERKLTGK